MIYQYMDAVYTSLIDRLGFEPVRDERGNILYRQDIKVLQGISGGKNALVEIINGDILDPEALRNKLEQSSNFLLANRFAPGINFFEVFVFSTTPALEKLQIIGSPKYKRSLSSLSVELETQKVQRFFRFPLSTHGIESILHASLYPNASGQDTTADVEGMVQRNQEELAITMKAKTPWLTYILFATNIAIFVLMRLYAYFTKTSFDQLLEILGQKDNYLIIAGEYWRFLTPVFLHGNEMHIFFNSYALYILGSSVERIYGHKKFAFIYVLAGLTGSIASFMFTPSPSVGASGSIFGLLGALLYFGVEKPRISKRAFGFNVIIMIVINIAFGMTFPGIDNWGHIGGLIGGFLAASIVRLDTLPYPFLSRYITIPLTMVVVTAALYYGFTNYNSQILYRISEADQKMNAGDFKQAEDLGEEALKMDPSYAPTKIYLLRFLINVEIKQNKVAEALDHAHTLYDVNISHEINTFLGLYETGQIYYKAQQYDLAYINLYQARQTVNTANGSDKKVLEEYFGNELILIENWLSEIERRRTSRKKVETFNLFTQE